MFFSCHSVLLFSLFCKVKPLRKRKITEFLPLPRAENKAALLQCKMLSENISTITSHSKVLALHKIICLWQFGRIQASMLCAISLLFLNRINSLAIVFKCFNHSCRYKQASYQNWLRLNQLPMSHLSCYTVHRCKPHQRQGGRNHDVVCIGVNKMSQLYKLEEKQPFANHLFRWLHCYNPNH